MANPQLESGYIRLANELWDAIMSRKFTGRQQKILKLILRLSYGCQHKTAIIPRLSDFACVGVRIQDARKEIAYLCQSQVITWDNKSTYTLNKNHDEWRISQVADWDEEQFNCLLSQNLAGKVTKNGSQLGDKSYEKRKLEVTKSGSQEEESYTKCKSEVTQSVSEINESAEESYKKCNSEVTKSVSRNLRKV